MPNFGCLIAPSGCLANSFDARARNSNAQNRRGSIKLNWNSSNVMKLMAITQEELMSKSRSRYRARRQGGGSTAVTEISVPLNSQIQFAVAEVLASTCQGLALLGSYSWPPHGK